MFVFKGLIQDLFVADSRQRYASLWAVIGTAAATPDELLEMDYQFCCASDGRQ